MNKAVILLVEDNLRIQLANKDMLELLGYEVLCATSLSEARSLLAVKTPDIIVLDIMLPDGSGLEFLGKLRRTSSVPILMLTALGGVEDTVIGLSLGADDYLAKPYDYNVLAARVEALLRRATNVPGTFTMGELVFNILAGHVFLRGKDMLLTGKEFSCLLLLAQNKDRVISAEYIYETVWHMPLSGNSQALRTIIARLRLKLSGSGYMIESQRKEGYIFQKGKN